MIKNKVTTGNNCAILLMPNKLNIGCAYLFFKIISGDVKINLFGQELNPQTYSICKSDMLISGEDPENIKLGSSLSNDQFEGKKFDYQMTNPPFGVAWKSE